MKQITPATEKQIEYIASLIAKLRSGVHRAALTHRTVGDFGPVPASHEASYKLIDGFFAAITIPADMSQTRASRWIELLKGEWAATMVRILDDAKIAESLGLAAYIAEHGEEALDRARKAL